MRLIERVKGDESVARGQFSEMPRLSFLGSQRSQGCTNLLPEIATKTDSPIGELDEEGARAKCKRMSGGVRVDGKRSQPSQRLWMLEGEKSMEVGSWKRAAASSRPGE